MILQYIIILLVSFFTSLVLILWFKKLFYRLKILDNPKKYWKKRDPIPYAMWVVFFISFFIISFLFIDYNYKLWLIWLFWFMITLISFLDDRLNVSAKVRLIFQIVIWAVIWITSIKIWYISNIFWWIANLETYHFELFNNTIYFIPLLFTILWYVFVFNALNWTDWIQWNTSWLSVISFFILFLLWFILFNNDDYEWWIKNAKFIMWISAILVWIIIPFWRFDIREKILMWDSWTMFLWFMLATLAIIAWWKIATVLVVFWIYSVDAVYVIVRRLLKKKNPLNWDFTHLHHRLQDIWMTKNQVLLLVYSLSFIFWLTALFLEKNWKIIVFFIIVVVVVFLNKIIEIVKIQKWKIKKNNK
jgi:UDP-GlcNAc:undecaprenyl-phosphate GlcNAc-1-phosphate transferase